MFMLKELRKEQGLKRSELARALQINANTLANYENGTREASYQTLVALADYFKISVDELLGRDEANFFAATPPRSLETTDEQRMLEAYRRLPSDDKARLQDYLSLLIERNSARKVPTAKK